MYLKSIEVYGFKSFANKITFEFQHGITGIVGPNGSGKSNVADAVRWVLGEQSAKQLRGAKMEDVIFSGTESRKPLGSAYVAITLDNSDHCLPIAYDEVTVARRVYRSGESEYSINGTSCRLKDITNLFLDTGIGKEGYSIIGQGQIDKILSGKPEERRELFDEAAGIVKYKKNKATSEKALESERQNLYRVNDILKELESQLEPLLKQSEKAKQYLSCKEQQKELDLSLFLLEMKRLKEEKEQFLEKRKINEEEIKGVRCKYEEIKKEYEQLEQSLEENYKKSEEIQQTIQSTELKREKMEGEIKVLKEQINTVKNDELHLEENTLRIEQQLEKHSQDKKEYEEEKQEFDKALTSMGQQLQELKETEEQQLQSIQDTSKEIELQKQTMIDGMNQTASLKGKLQRYETMAEQVQLRRAELNQRLLHYRSEEAKQKEEYDSLSEKSHEMKEKLLIAESELSRKERQLVQLQEELNQQRQQSSSLQREYHVVESRLETMKNMTERYEGYGNSIKRVMEQKSKKQGIHGVVADLIKTDKKYEIAIETALGGSIQNIVTEDEQIAKELIEYLKKNRYGRATFLPLTSVKGRSNSINPKVLEENGVLGIASNLVRIEPIYKGIIEHLLGRIIIVDTIDNGIRLARNYQYSLRIVTLEGESLSAGGAMTGGAFKNNSNLLGRRREILELENQREDVLKGQKEVEESLLSLQKEKDQCKESLELTKKERQDLVLQMNTIELKISTSEKQKQELQVQYERLRKENQELEQQIVEIKENQESIVAYTKEQEEKRLEQEGTIKQLELELSRLKAQKDTKAEQYHKVNMDYMSIKQKIDFVQMNLKRILSEERELLSQKREYEKKSMESKEKVNTLSQSIEQLLIETKQCEDQIKDIKISLKEKEQERQTITTSHKALFEKREQIAEQLSGLDKEEYRLKGQQEKIEEAIINKSNYMWEEYEITYGNALGMGKAVTKDLDSLKKSLVQVKSQIKALGDVNVNAIEDYKNVSERYTFLSAQKEDIIKAEENLIQIIKELDIAMRERFTEKFAQIQVMFQKVFQELFGGGKATLELMEGEDVLEAGIRIISQPPGKKLQNMMQLSGGEKALTAIALLFAIQSLKPSPFCLLDEIEAALDDSNVDRFAKYLHKLTKDTQFIVITHRRGTMVSADVLYGITMQEKGVSALVSVSLIENQLEQ